MGIPSAVIQLAAKQGGYVNRSQLVDLGYSTSAIDRRLANAELKRVVANVYQVFPPSDHVDLIRGAVLALPGAVVSHQSAAHMLGFPLLPRLRPTVTVPSHTTHVFPGVTVRRCFDLDPTHVAAVGDLSVTNVQRTAFDLAAVLRPKLFDRVAEALILAERMSIDQLEAVVDQVARRGKPGSRAARVFIATREGTLITASALERKGRTVLAAGGLPSPVPQYPIPWDPHRRFDDAYPQSRLAIEWDSRAWHLQREAMTSDRRRDRDAASHGWLVLRFTYEDLKSRQGEVVPTVATLLKTRQP